MDSAADPDPASSSLLPDPSPVIPQPDAIFRPPPLWLVAALFATTLLGPGLVNGPLLLGFGPKPSIFLRLLGYLGGQLFGAYLVLLIYRLFHRRFHYTRDALGIGAGAWEREKIASGLRLYLWNLPAIMLLNLFVSLLAERYGLPIERPMIQYLFGQVKANPWASLLLLTLVGVGAPLYEELVFRGFLHAALRPRWSASLTIGMTALIFTFLHEPSRIFQDPRLFPFPIFYLGIVLGMVRERTGSVAPGIVLHGLNNAMAFALTLLATPAR